MVKNAALFPESSLTHLHGFVTVNETRKQFSPHFQQEFPIFHALAGTNDGHKA